MGLTEDFREDLSQGQEEETGWVPKPQISAARLCSSLRDQTQPSSKHKATPKEEELGDCQHLCLMPVMKKKEPPASRTMESARGTKSFKRRSCRMQTFCYKKTAI